MAITQFTTTPLSTDPTNFSSRMDTRILEQQTFVTEANALATEMNLYATFGAGAALALNGFKNKIIGGDFNTNPWQWGTSFISPASGAYTADRWVYGKVGSAVHTVSKAVDAPTVVQSSVYTGFCLGLAVTTAQTTFAAGDTFTIGQRIEGLNSASFGFGQAGSRFFTKSFWVKAAKTGIHCVSFRNSALTRSYVAEYTITTANTWELKKITVPVDTSGTWLYDTGIGLTATFALAGGTTFQTTVNTWQTGNFLTTANQVNELDTIGNNFKIALVQIEPGSIFTAFESQSATTVRTLCERYYQEGESGSSDSILFSGNVTSGSVYSAAKSFKVAMRAAATVTLTNNSATSFAATTGTVGAGTKGFTEARTANATGAGGFVSNWIATAEL